MITYQMGEFRDEHHLKALWWQVSATTCDKKQLNSLKALDVDILMEFGIILDPQTIGTNNLNLVAIANPREMVCYSLKKDVALTAITIIFVPVDENLRTTK